MKLYAIHASAYNWHADTSVFHTIMFHGEAAIPADRYGIASHDMGESDMKPMRLNVNGYRLADVFLPANSCNLVVSERVMRELDPLRSNFMFLPVEFRKVYSLPWSRDGQITTKVPDRLLRFWERGGERGLLKSGRHDPQLAATLPQYFELVGHNHYVLLDQFPPTHQFFTKYYDEDPANKSDLIPVSEAQFREYPISSSSYPIVRDDIYDVLLRYLDTPFFGIKEFSFDT